MELWIFISSTPGTSDPEASRRGPGCQNLAFQRFETMILFSFLWRIRWTTLENHGTKQMMVYEQITCFIKHIVLYIFGGESKNRILNQKNTEPEPDRTRTGPNRSQPKPNRTEPLDSCVLLGCHSGPVRSGPVGPVGAARSRAADAARRERRGSIS